MLADFVDGADVGMIERRRGARFPSKAFQRLRIAREFIGQEFERNKAPEFGVLCLVDDTHPAAAQLFDDSIVRNGFADHRLMPAPFERFILPYCKPWVSPTESLRMP